MKKLHKPQARCAELKFSPATEIELQRIGEIPDGYVAGWASTAGIDLYRHKVMPNAFADSIKSRGLNGPRSIKLLMGHDWNKIAGTIKHLDYRNNNLWIEAQLNLGVSYVKDLYTVTKDLGGLNFSVGFVLQDYQFKEDDNKDDYLQIDRGDLFEVSVVPFPGNEEAIMEFVKGMPTPDDVEDGVDEFAHVASLADFEKALVAAGYCKKRQEAARLTLAVKSLRHLFNSKEPHPRLDVSKIQAASDLVAKAKSIFAADRATID